MTIKIAFLGDVCLTGKFDLQSNSSAMQQFNEIRSVLSGYDIVLANLESPFTTQTSSKICKAIHIKSSPVNAKLLHHIGVNAVSLANNHIFDYGHEGHESTQLALESVGIKYFGTQGRTVMLERNNECLLLGGFCCLSAHPSKANVSGVNTLRYSSLKEFLVSAEKQEAFPVASIHWGDENIHYPREEHVRFARLMAADHDFLLHGHHPHVVQGLEYSGNSLIAYSLGNFCTDQHSSQSIHNLQTRHTPENQKSYVLGITVENGSIQGSEIIPVADIGGDITVMGQEERDRIAGYSIQLAESYRRPEAGAVAAPRGALSIPVRFSAIWLLRRLNYNFIGACIKGLLNHVRYVFYYYEIHRKSDERNI